MSVAIHPDHAAFLDREREPAMLERERCLTEQFAAPPVQRGDIGIVVGRDLFEIVNGRDHLTCHRVTL